MKPVLYFLTAENKITGTHISISITNKEGKPQPTPILNENMAVLSKIGIITETEQKNHSAARLLHF
jgi:hypothetical protein